MAVNIRQLFPIRQAKLRRSQMPRYLQLDGGRYLIAAALLLSLMSLITLGQTGRLTSQGYQLAQLQAHRTDLLRERNTLNLRLSEAQSLAEIERRARELKMRPMSAEQARYITIAPQDAAPLPADVAEQPRRTP